MTRYAPPAARTPQKSTNLSLVALAGVGFAAVGLSHFVAPRPWIAITRVAFPRNTPQWVRRNGVTEVALGSLIVADATRPIGYAATAGYAGLIGFRITVTTASNTRRIAGAITRRLRRRPNR